MLQEISLKIVTLGKYRPAVLDLENPLAWQVLYFKNDYIGMAELKNIRIAVSGIYDYAKSEIPTLRIPMPGAGAPEWVEDKNIYKVYRPASVLAAACSKFANLPLTHHHPRTPIDGQNFRDLAVGWTGEHPETDFISETDEVGIRSTCVLYDDEALTAYERGEIQLSPGYIAVFEWSNGTDPHGNEYDIIMKEITDVNHLALLPAGRGGEYAVVMDEAVKRKTIFDLVKEKTDDGAPEGNQNARKDYVSEEDKEKVSDKDAEEIINRLHEEMVEFPDVDFTDENYEKYLGKPLDTPIGKIKISDGQKQKLVDSNRTHLIGAISETLQHPGYMCKDTDGKTLFIKTFKRKDRPQNIISVIIEKDGLKINVSTHYKRDNQIKNIIKRAEPLKEASSVHGTVHDERVAECDLNITDNDSKVKSIFDIAKGSVFDRVKGGILWL